MSCEFSRHLVAYHFGLIEDAERESLESHLLSCGDCVRELVETKRAIELGAESAARPSREARAKLRRAVAIEVGVPRQMAAERKWWERPVALALAASIVLAAGATTRAITSGPGAPPHGVAQR